MQENTNYSASYTVTKKIISFMKDQNMTKITYLPGCQLCVIKRKLQTGKNGHDAMAQMHSVTVTVKHVECANQSRSR
jgi:hypothetical protein